MGYVENITHDKFPKQGSWLGKKCKVLFRYGSDNEPELMGVIIRDDVEEPFRGIIKLDDGRYILMTECQYSIQD